MNDSLSSLPTRWSKNYKRNFLSLFATFSEFTCKLTVCFHDCNIKSPFTNIIIWPSKPHQSLLSEWQVGLGHCALYSPTFIWKGPFRIGTHFQEKKGACMEDMRPIPCDKSYTKWTYTDIFYFKSNRWHEWRVGDARFLWQGIPPTGIKPAGHARLFESLMVDYWDIFLGTEGGHADLWILLWTL